ncbi:MAG: hypothetical protein HN990_04205 [Flavobacteriaceae bacterium]|nr:hypothetical protein [Flavobacteriaceae bacterium]
MVLITLKEILYFIILTGVVGYIFTGIFVTVMESVLAAAGKHSLLVRSQQVAVNTN